jgi:hypothetical protein
MRRLGCRRSKGAFVIDVRTRFQEVLEEAAAEVHTVCGASGRFRRVGCQVSSRRPFTFMLGLEVRGIGYALSVA